MNTSSLTIGSHRIGFGNPCYIIAELSANHAQNLDNALQIVRAAKDAGADAIKLQTYTADTITIDCRTEVFRVGKGSLWEGKNLYDLYKEAYTPWEWQPIIAKLAGDLGLDCFSTPFDSSAISFLEKMNVPAYKVASFELVDLPLIERIASTGKPAIMSTGMASLSEIEEAVTAFRRAGGTDLALLKCTSAYPADPSEMNLQTIRHMASTFSIPVGLSDHTLGIEVPVAAVSLGACIIEKHLTLSREVKGPDSAFSLEPAEFSAMVNAVRIVEKAMGKISYETTASEKASCAFRRSLFVVKPISAGTLFTEENVRSIRPAAGLHPRYLPQVLGKKAAVDISSGTPLSWDLISR